MGQEHVFRISALFGSDGKMNYKGPREGSDLLPWIGPCKGTIIKGTLGKGFNEPHHPNISWEIRLQDEGCEGGATIVTNKALTGDDASGGANERHTADVMLSSGIFGPTDEANLPNTLATMEAWLLQNGGPGGLLSGEFIVQACTGKPVIVDIGAGSSQKTGAPISTVDNFTTQASYDSKKKNPGMFRQQRPEPTKAQPKGPVQPVGVGPAVQNMGGAAVPGRAPQALGAPAPRPPVQQQFVTPGAAPLAQAPNFAQPGVAPMQPAPFNPNGAGQVVAQPGVLNLPVAGR